VLVVVPSNTPFGKEHFAKARAFNRFEKTAGVMSSVLTIGAI